MRAQFRLRDLRWTNPDALAFIPTDASVSHHVRYVIGLGPLTSDYLAPKVEILLASALGPTTTNLDNYQPTSTRHYTGTPYLDGYLDSVAYSGLSSEYLLLASS